MTDSGIVRTALPLVIFAILGTLLVATANHFTQERIQTNEHEVLLKLLHSLISEHGYDNDILNDAQELKGKVLQSQHPILMYPALLNGKPAAAIFRLSTPDGYNGPIHLLIGIDYNTEHLLGVRVLAHRETPGLGDKIESDRSDWILKFLDRSIGNPLLERWHVKKDGGEFDQFTGATITPRAVVGAIRRCLIYFSENKKELFAKIPQKTEKPS